MIVFHGSYGTVEKPEVSRGRDKVDFGKGFYLTRLRDQASMWASIVARRHRGGVAIVNSFEFDMEQARMLAGVRRKAFRAYDL